MDYTFPNRASIEAEILQQFRRELASQDLPTDQSDPLIRILFRSFSASLERLYSDREEARKLLLDELIDGLEVERRTARPAQTVIHFESSRSHGIQLPDDLSLIGQANDGDKIPFMIDMPIRVCGTDLAFAIAYQNGTVQLSSEGTHDKQGAASNRNPISFSLGQPAVLYLAFEPLGPAHLSNVGLYIGLGTNASDILGFLQSECWRLADNEGNFPSSGFMRSSQGPGGIRKLSFVLSKGREEYPDERDISRVPLPTGPFGGRVFVFPGISEGNQWKCVVPTEIKSIFPRLFPQADSEFMNRPRAWLKIILPPDVSKITTGISAVQTNCISASNVEVINRSLHFDQDGACQPVSISKEGGADSFFLHPLSLLSESNEEYLRFADPSSSPYVGRYGVKGGRIEVTAARRTGNEPTNRATLRFLSTKGAKGNGIDSGAFQAAVSMKDVPDLQLYNLVPSAGGRDEEDSARAQMRLSHAILSRNRIVTRKDLDVAARSYDWRIGRATIEREVVRSNRGLFVKYVANVTLKRHGFPDQPEVERELLLDDLRTFLAAKLPMDIELIVKSSWEEGPA